MSIINISQQEKLKEKAKEYNEKNEKKGVCYLSRIPPYMNVAQIRKLLSAYNIERIYLHPEDESRRKHRIKVGGNRKKCYTEGWIEFSDKKIAKRTALSLNCTKMVPKKRGFYSDDLWNIVYLPKFKWENLTEKLAYDERIRKEKIKTEISQEKKKQDFYMEKLDLSKKVMGMEKRKKRKLENSENKDINLMMRQFKQHQSVHNLFKDEENE